MLQEMHTATTEEEIRTALCRDAFYGQIALSVVVPPGYIGASRVEGIPVEISEDATEPYIVPAEGGRLGFDGNELRIEID